MSIKALSNWYECSTSQSQQIPLYEGITSIRLTQPRKKQNYRRNKYTRPFAGVAAAGGYFNPSTFSCILDNFNHKLDNLLS